jgi:hypothetical protein
MGLRERLARGWWWTLNTEMHREGGVLVSPSGSIGWVYGRILGVVGGSFVVILDLRWEMAPRLDYGVSIGIGI